MSYDPLSAASRRHRRRQKLGHSARCAICGIADPTILIQVDRAFFDEHHPLGEAHAPHLKITVCRNCHARLSAGQVDDGVPLEPQSTVLERLIAIILALGSLLRMLAEELLTWASKGGQFVQGLDSYYPTWRLYEWAR
jgi:hypothetical protein